MLFRISQLTACTSIIGCGAQDKSILAASKQSSITIWRRTVCTNVVDQDERHTTSTREACLSKYAMKVLSGTTASNPQVEVQMSSGCSYAVIDLGGTVRCYLNSSPYVSILDRIKTTR